MEATLPPVTSALKARFGTQVTETHQALGDETVVVAREAVVPVLTFLRDEQAMNFLTSLTVTDYLTYPTPKPSRFEVVYHLFSLTTGARLRVKAPVNLGESVATASGLWRIADWMEREAWEMYGVKFEGHPNLKRLLTHTEFVGYPLRKDYPLKKRQPLSESDTLMDEMNARLLEKGLK